MSLVLGAVDDHGLQFLVEEERAEAEALQEVRELLENSLLLEVQVGVCDLELDLFLEGELLLDFLQVFVRNSLCDPFFLDLGRVLVLGQSLLREVLFLERAGVDRLHLLQLVSRADDLFWAGPFLVCVILCLRVYGRDLVDDLDEHWLLAHFLSQCCFCVLILMVAGVHQNDVRESQQQPDPEDDVVVRFGQQDLWDWRDNWQMHVFLEDLAVVVYDGCWLQQRALAPQVDLLRGQVVVLLGQAVSA